MEAQDTKALQLELESGLKRYGPLQDEVEPMYQVRLALTPLER